jgi:glycosyltransferase involved in cell wall biosynthesis
MKVLAHSSHVGNTGYNAHSQGFFRKLSEKVEVKLRNFSVSSNWNNKNMLDPHGVDVNDVDKKMFYLQTVTENLNYVDIPLYSYDEQFIPDIHIVLNVVNHRYFNDYYEGKKIAYTVWENSEYPLDFLYKLHEYDQVWVPTDWQAKLTIKQGIPKQKVKIVREAIDDLYKPKKTEYDDGIFRFLVFGGWSDRKSTSEILRIFKKIYGNNKKVELVLNAENCFFYDGCRSAQERMVKYNVCCNNIKLVHNLPRSEYLDYIQKGNVFLSCARGEGWNIPLMESMACGTPAIYSSCSGQLEFALGKGIPIKIKDEVPASNYNCNNTPGFWYEPDFEDLESKMIDVYENYSVYKQKAMIESELIRKEFTWDKSVNQALIHLNELMNK